MGSYEKTEKILGALASKTRLQILDSIQKGVSNPGDVARELKRHRSTVEKHLRVLLRAGIIEKVPSLGKSGQLTIRYRLSPGADDLLKVVCDVSERF